MQIFLICLIAVLVIFVAFLVVSLLFFNFSIQAKPRRKNTDLPPNASRARQKNKMLDFRQWYFSQNIKYEYINSFDELKLCTQILEQEKSKKTVIMMHGFRAQDHDDFCGSIKFFYDDGFNIILPQQRGHEKSEGKFLTYGYKESFDCKKWVEFAIKRYGADSEIVLYGVSMGCATVLLTLTKNLPSNVKCCIADCGYTCVTDIFSHVLGSKYHLPVFPILNLTKKIARYFADFDWAEASPLEAVKENKIPVLFIHGDKDKFVPCEMTQRNFDACTSEKELLIIEGATHAMSFLVAPEKCWNTAQNFVYKYMKRG
ncbi:MAG: alpha/beta hydrolase [Clostridia bacterium]